MEKIDLGSRQFAVIAMSLFAALCVSPFIVYRIAEKNYFIAAFDIMLTITCISFSYLINTERKAEIGARILTLLASIEVIFIVYTEGYAQAYWIFPVMIAMYFINKPALTLWTNIIVLMAIIPKIYSSAHEMEFLTIISSIVVTNVFVFIFAYANSIQKNRMYKLAWFDGLTGINNRRALDKSFDLIRDEGVQVSIIAIDIDNFKNINDTYGHAIGDRVLIETVEAIKPNIRATDNIYRYGGEEFVLVAFETDYENAKIIAEKLRTIVEDHQYTDGIGVTISLGVTSMKMGEDPLSCFDRSDQALYQAKKAGKNRTHYI